MSRNTDALDTLLEAMARGVGRGFAEGLPTADDPEDDLPENPNRGIEGATWDTYRRTDWDDDHPAVCAVRVPKDCRLNRSYLGVDHASGGDYLVLEGETFDFVDAEEFAENYERTHDAEVVA